MGFLLLLGSPGGVSLAERQRAALTVLGRPGRQAASEAAGPVTGLPARRKGGEMVPEAAACVSPAGRPGSSVAWRAAAKGPSVQWALTGAPLRGWLRGSDKVPCLKAS